MAKPVILMQWASSGPYLAALQRTGLEQGFDIIATTSPDPPADVLARTEVLLAIGPADGLLARMPSLRLIQSISVGVDQWTARPDYQPARHILAAARGTHRIAMPENILGAIFYATKPFHVAKVDQAERRWRRRMSEPLAGKTLAILGLGAIGKELARKAAALDLRVIGIKRDSAPVPHVEKVYRLADLDQVLGQANFVVLLLPLTEETRDLIDQRRLSAMRKDAWLFNYGRGPLAVDDDLVAAAQSGTIAGAVLDVFRVEPLPAEHPFWGVRNITVLPHFGGFHPGRDEVVAELFADNVRRLVAGEPIRERVGERGY
jgi:phosphoglycerate dehydrogenase-like enzyme